MANKIFYQEDCNLSLLDGKKIAIIGYGSQGHASSCFALCPLLYFSYQKKTSIALERSFFLCI